MLWMDGVLLFADEDLLFQRPLRVRFCYFLLRAYVLRPGWDGMEYHIAL